MRVTFHINADELDENFFKALKALYKGQVITLSVDAEDETSYLLSDPENRKRLLEAKESEEVYHFNLDEFAELAKKLEEGEEISEDDLSKVKRS